MAERRRGPARARRRERKNVPAGRAYIQSSFNNTLVTITDPQGNALCWSSSGAAGFKGSRKSTPYAAGLAADSAARKAMEQGMRTLMQDALEKAMRGITDVKQARSIAVK